MTQQDIIDSLPAHLRPFVKTQHYGEYSPRDQAVWRFIMRHLTRQLADTAHPVYLEGLARTGISLDHIPSIEEMNERLASLGWRAVVVDGFIPPAIFMEFQALKVLVIALEMRSVEHIYHTPAPDIVHESAGHAPFIVDVDYAEFLQRFGEVGLKAIATADDLTLYEAIRQLSVIKEQPNSTEADIANAESALVQTIEETPSISEAAQLTRLHWWTVEYGLVGEIDDYRIFGAGLLSSLGESRNCLNDTTVRKIPLTLDAVLTPYDITEEQPQLFVTKSCKHLSQVLEEFAASMCFTRGGAPSLQIAIDAGSVCTAEYDTGVQVSGKFSAVKVDAVGNATYLQTAGPTQLAYKSRQIFGHSTEAHRDGFGSPIGHLKDFSRCLSDYTIDELKAHSVEIGKQVRLEYLSGITVSGKLEGVFRQDHRNLLLTLSGCHVVDLQGNTLFEPAWGNFDLAVGASICSVYGGVADREQWQLYDPTPPTASQTCNVDQGLLDAYWAIAELRKTGVTIDSKKRFESILNLLEQYSSEWLLQVEALQVAGGEPRRRIETGLKKLARDNPDIESLISLELSLQDGKALKAS